MNKKARQLTFMTFFGLFLLAAPMVVLYTAGYRFNPKKIAIVKTGVLAISSEPKKAEIFIDGKENNNETNAIIKNVMPAEHMIRLEKNNYWPWEKILTIEANATTFVEKAELFLKANPEEKNIGDFSAYAFNQTDQKIALALSAESWTEIWSRDLATDEEKLLSRLPENGLGKITMEWSPFDPAILLLAEAKESTTLWRQLRDDGQNEITSPNPHLVWQRDPNQFLFTEEENGQSNLIYRDDSNKETILAILPYGQYEFLPAPPTLILLREPNKKRTVLVDDRGLGQPILLNASGLPAGWNPTNEKQLLYISDFELRIFDAEKINDELLTRLSIPIVAAAWHASGYDVLFTDGKNFQAMELDNRGGQRQVWTLATLEEIMNFSLSTDGKTAHLAGTNKGKNTIYKILLQE